MGTSTKSQINLHEHLRTFPKSSHELNTSRIIRQHLIIHDYSLQITHATLIHDLFIQLSRLTLIQILKPNLRKFETDLKQAETILRMDKVHDGY